MATDAVEVSEYADKFRRYVAKPEVAAIYRALEVCARAIDSVQSIANSTLTSQVIDALTKTSPAIAVRLSMFKGLAANLGPAGAALGVGVDLMVMFGLVQDETVAALNGISHQIESLRGEVRRSFADLKVCIDTSETLQRFFRTFDRLQANVQVFEQNVMEGNTDGDILYERLGMMVKHYPPHKIVRDLRQLHNRITGDDQFGKPLFEQLAERGYDLQGKELDDFVVNHLLQFQVVLALEVRAVRMLRSFIAYEEQDPAFATDLKVIFQDLTCQRCKFDPQNSCYGWYVQFKAFGGTFKITTEKWPERFLYMQHTGNIRGIESPYCKGERSVFKIEPLCDEKFLISTKEWPEWYLYMSGVLWSTDGDVRGWFGDPGRQGYWYFKIKDIRERTFELTTHKWPNWYMYMDKNGIFMNVAGKKGEPGPQGHFKLLPV